MTVRPASRVSSPELALLALAAERRREAGRVALGVRILAA